MSIAESPIATVKRFSNSWSTLNSNQLKAEFESIHKETNRKPDTYPFIVQAEKLVDPNTNRPVEEFVGGGKEGSVFLKLQEWAIKNESGLAIWISPPLENVYPCAKVILSRIAYDTEGNKHILNSAITMDLSEEIYNSEYKRGTLYETEDKEENIMKVLSWIERKTHQKVKTSESDNGQSEYYIGLINQGHSIDYVITEMQQSGYIGQASISCPTNVFSNGSRFNMLVSGGKDRYGSLEFECPSCKQKNTRPYGQLITNCQHCGADVRC